MLLIEEKITNPQSENKEQDYLVLSWFDAKKRILRTTSKNGRDIALKFKENLGLNHNDCLYDKEFTLWIKIAKEEVVEIFPKNTYELALSCYQIGNMHLSLFYKDEKLLSPYDEGIIRFLDQFEISYQKNKERLEPKYMLKAPNFLKLDMNFKAIKC